MQGSRMKSDRRSLLCAGLATSGLLSGKLSAQMPPPGSGGILPLGLPQPVETIELWPSGAPGMPSSPPKEVTTERSRDTLVTDRAALGIAAPRLVVFRPDRPSGAAVLLTPGGGYNHVVVDKEGYEMGRWLSDRGFTAFVLFYRLPYDRWEAGADVSLADAQRAMRVIRHRAGDYEVEPERVAAMGFSAGGHLCADLSTRFGSPVYPAQDEADHASSLRNRVGAALRRFG